MYRIKKVNDVVVRPPQSLIRDKDPRPVKGAKMFEEPYANIFICSRKKSGKSITIFNILKQCVGRDTTVIFFCSTLYKDAVYKNMQNMLEQNGVNFIGYTSLKGGDVDHLQDLVDCMELKAEEECNMEDEPKTSKNDLCNKLFDDGEEEEGKPRKKRKTKYLSPEYIIIFDDLSDELKSKSLVTLLKKNRHWLMKIIVSSQHYNDLLPESRKQIDYILIFRNITENKLVEMHRDCNLAMSFEEFKKVYAWATKEKYSFLYVDCINDIYRRNFNTEIEVKE